MTATKNLVTIRSSSGMKLGYLASTDGTEGEIKIVNTPGDTGKSLGDALTNNSIFSIKVLCGTPSDLDRIVIYDENDAIIWEGEGNITAAKFPAPNFEAEDLSIGPVKKGWSMKILTSD